MIRLSLLGFRMNWQHWQDGSRRFEPVLSALQQPEALFLQWSWYWKLMWPENGAHSLACGFNHRSEGSFLWTEQLKFQFSITILSLWGITRLKMGFHFPSCIPDLPLLCCVYISRDCSRHSGRVCVNSGTFARLSNRPVHGYIMA